MKLTMMPATTAIVLICVLTTLVGIWPGFLENMLAVGAFIPARLYMGEGELGALVNSLPVVVTPFTSVFIQTGIFDLLISGLLLMLLGNMTEKVLGWHGLLALFFAGIIASTIAIILVAGDTAMPFYGSFNAISAIIGAYLILYPIAQPRTWGTLSPENSRILQLLLLWFLINMAMNLSTSFSAMLFQVIPTMASFAAGLLLARPLLLWKYRNA